MDNNLADFLRGDSNVVKVETVISREKTTHGTELIHVMVGDQEVYNFWRNPNKIKGPPKHTGGKKPYVLLMVEQMDLLRNSKINNIEELIGFLVCLSNNIEWHTGKLVHKRSKKQLKYTDLQKLFSGGKRKLDRVLADLKTHDLLFNTTEGYFISNKLIKKGATRNG